jgi:hypothetical protein
LQNGSGQRGRRPCYDVCAETSGDGRHAYPDQLISDNRSSPAPEALFACGAGEMCVRIDKSGEHQSSAGLYYVDRRSEAKERRSVDIAYSDDCVARDQNIGLTERLRCKDLSAGD